MEMSATSPVQLLGHCIFCLRKVDSDSRSGGEHENLEIRDYLSAVPNSTNQVASSELSATMLSSLNHVWPYLQKTSECAKLSGEGGGCEPKEFAEDVETLDQCRASNKKVIFSELPTMCVYCAEEMLEVNKLLRHLFVMLNKLSAIIKDSKFDGRFSWRSQNFLADLIGSNLEISLVNETLRFLKVQGWSDGVDESLNDDCYNADFPCDLENAALDGLWDDFPTLEFQEKLFEDKQNYFEDKQNYFDDKPMDCEDENCQLSEVGSIDVDDISELDDDIMKPEEDLESNTPAKELNDSVSGQEVQQQQAPAVSLILVDNAMYYALSTNQDQPVIGENSHKHSFENDTFTTKIIPETHSDTLSCKSNECGQTLIEKTDLMNQQETSHEILTTNEIDVACKFCNEGHANRTCRLQQKRPKNLDFLDPTASQKCDLCKEKVPLSQIFEHVIAHVNGAEEYLTKCPNTDCSCVYIKPYSLSDHLQRSRRCQDAIGDVQKVIRGIQTCEVCGYKAQKAVELRSHLRHLHETFSKNFSCPIEGCLRWFTVKQSVVLHLAQHSQRDIVDIQECDQCIEKMSPSEMTVHLREIHQIQEVFACSHCPFVFSTRESHCNHLFVHKNDALLCAICDDGVKYTKHAQLREHYFVVHNIGRPFQCEKCDSVFMLKTDFVNHTKECYDDKTLAKIATASISVDQQENLGCDECGSGFQSAELLQAHKIKQHGARPYACQICENKRFKSLKSLQKHQFRHEDGSLKGYKCEADGCGIIFLEKKAIQRHVAVFHLDSGTYVCEFCGKSFACDKSLTSHKNSVHLGLRLHICDICGEKFVTRTVFNIHILNHVEERPFECESCDKRFRTKNALEKHNEGHQMEKEEGA